MRREALTERKSLMMAEKSAAEVDHRKEDAR